jgi:hypothetical protein
MSRVRVHFHLTRRCLVVSTKGPKGWRVERYSDAPVCLRNVTFVVSDKGRDYCRAKGARWVHAWAEGELCDCLRTDGVPVNYNPFRDLGFVTPDAQLVTHGEHVRFELSGTGRARRILTTVGGAS